jgi:hypothetical protein
MSSFDTAQFNLPNCFDLNMDLGVRTRRFSFQRSNRIIIINGGFSAIFSKTFLMSVFRHAQDSWHGS